MRSHHFVFLSVLLDPGTAMTAFCAPLCMLINVGQIPTAHKRSQNTTMSA